MSNALASLATSTTTQSDAGRYRVNVTSVGSADPAKAKSIALGLGVPVQSVLDALYKAPRVLVDGLDVGLADQMAGLLKDLGCETAVQPMLDPAPTPAILFDVAIHVTDTARYGEVCDNLGAFIGASAEDAARLISTPPGIVLGSVSPATIAALSTRLGDAVTVTSSRPELAIYEVFLGECDAPVQARVLSDLRARGHDPVSDQGCILSGLTKAQADALWLAHRATQALRIVNRDFLRFDLVLTGGHDTPSARGALTNVAGVPARIVPQLFDAMPIAVIEAIPNPELEGAMTALSEAGLQIRADLITFLHLGVEIVASRAPERLRDALMSLGVLGRGAPLPALPYRLPYRMPELQARLLRDTLNAAGSEVELIDPDGEMP